MRRKIARRKNRRFGTKRSLINTKTRGNSSKSWNAITETGGDWWNCIHGVQKRKKNLSKHRFGNTIVSEKCNQSCLVFHVVSISDSTFDFNFHFGIIEVVLFVKWIARVLAEISLEKESSSYERDVKRAWKRFDQIFLKRTCNSLDRAIFAFINCRGNWNETTTEDETNDSNLRQNTNTFARS